jgi:hypothetical protein
MPTNEEGEFELVLGNKQLLSVFFIVVVLLGVFFTMGYIVGRNTLSGGPQAASGKSGRPGAVEPQPGSELSAAPVTEPDRERPSPSGSAVPSETPKQTAEPPPPQPEPPKPATARSEPAGQDPARPAPAEPPVSGQYLQVAATRKSEAGLLAEVLTKKGYSTVVQPVPDAELFRVLVGPLRDADVMKTREALTAAGFKPFPRKL